MRRPDREADGKRAHLLDGLGLGLGDAVQRLLLAPLERGLELGLRVAAVALGLGDGLLRDLDGLAERSRLLPAVVGEQALGFLAQALGLIELGADGAGALVEPGGKGALCRPPECCDKDDEADGDPEFR